MNEKQIIKIVIFLYSVLIFTLSVVTGKSIDDNLFRWISGVTSLVVIIWTVYDKWIWRKWVFKYLSQLLQIPIIHGTWKGKLKYERDEDGNSDEVDVYVAINQTLSSISICSFFEKPSTSKSITAKIEKEEPGRKKLVYLYKSEAPYGKRDNNRPHDGISVLDLIGNPVKKLLGSYFTERKGAGTIVLDKYSKILAENFADAEQLDFKSL
jgi:hypothetical protein